MARFAESLHIGACRGLFRLAAGAQLKLLHRKCAQSIFTALLTSSRESAQAASQRKYFGRGSLHSKHGCRSRAGAGWAVLQHIRHLFY